MGPKMVLGPILFSSIILLLAAPVNGFQVSLRTHDNNKYVTLQGNKLTAQAARPAGPMEQFDMTRNDDDGTYAIKAANGMFVAIDDRQQKRLIAQSGGISVGERFFVEDVGGGFYALKSKINNNHVSAAWALKKGDLVADRGWVGPWEKFNIEGFQPGGGGGGGGGSGTPPIQTCPQCGSCVLKTHDKGKYVTLQGAKLTAQADAGGPSEKFEIGKNADGTYAIKGSNGMYVMIDNGQQKRLMAQSGGVGDGEKFYLEDVGGGYFALKSKMNNNHVTAAWLLKKGDLVADRGWVGPWEKFIIDCDGGGSTGGGVTPTPPVEGSGSGSGAGWGATSGSGTSPPGAGSGSITYPSGSGSGSGTYPPGPGPGATTLPTICIFKCKGNGKYVTGWQDPKKPCSAQSDKVGDAEKFGMARNEDDGTYSLMSSLNSNYVSCNPKEGATLTCAAQTVSDSERFYVYDLGGGNYAIRAKVNGKLCTADLGNGGQMVANKDTLDDAASFSIEDGEGEQQTSGQGSGGNEGSGYTSGQ